MFYACFSDTSIIVMTDITCSQYFDSGGAAERLGEYSSVISMCENNLTNFDCLNLLFSGIFIQSC